MYRYIIFLSTLITSVCFATGEAITATINPSQLATFEELAPPIKSLIKEALHLADLNLTYRYGSQNPSEGGMDCSGTIYYLLSQQGAKDVPRQADEFYLWVKEKGQLYTTSNHQFDADEFKYLHPGDLLFWSGTYSIKRTVPITHVMLYLGKNAKGQPLMFGSSDGRTYQHHKMRGVSVFDFILPTPQSTGKFIGYGCIPNLTCGLIVSRGAATPKS